MLNIDQIREMNSSNRRNILLLKYEKDQLELKIEKMDAVLTRLRMLKDPKGKRNAMVDEMVF
jgi:hypothetical protein